MRKRTDGHTVKHKLTLKLYVFVWVGSIVAAVYTMASSWLLYIQWLLHSCHAKLSLITKQGTEV